MTRITGHDTYSRIRTALGAIDVGPTEDDLADAPVLRDWAVAVAPLRGIHLGGHAHGHPRLPEGAWIVTSRLLAIDPGARWARTISRWYRLDGAMNSYPEEDLRRLSDTLTEQLERAREGLPPLH